MKHSKWIVLLVSASMLTACSEPDGSPGRGVTRGGAVNKTDIGTAAGAIGGGVLGYQFGGGAGKAVATVGGALLGGLLGRSVGNSLDNADVSAYDRESQYALESGRQRRWENPRTGNYGTIYPDKRYTDDEGRYCREYRQTIYVGGRSHDGYGLACRNDDGSWQIIE